MQVKVTFELTPSDSEDVEDNDVDTVCDQFRDWLSDQITQSEFEATVENPDFDDEENADEPEEIDVVVRVDIVGSIDVV